MMGDLSLVPQTLFRRQLGEAHVVGLPGEFDLKKELARAVSVHLRLRKEMDGKIRNIKKGDVVFLYRSGKWHPEVPGKPGIVAFGIATGNLRERPSENASCMELSDFRRVYPVISAAQITAMNGSPIVFGQVWQRPNRELAEALYREALQRCS